MVKEAKFFRKQAQKADNVATRASDLELEAEFRALARAYRSQAAVVNSSSGSRSGEATMAAYMYRAYQEPLPVSARRPPNSIFGLWAGLNIR
jgi:hypothetical protein